MRFWFCLWLTVLPGWCAEDAAPWRDALLGLRTDATGAVWNFQENGELGRVGSSALNRGQMLLVDGEAFAAQSACMSADGNEFLVSGQVSGGQQDLVVARRIRLEPASGVVRYVELLRNEGAASRSLHVELRTNLNGHYRRFASSRGREMPVALEPDETGFWLEPDAAKEGGRAYAFSITGPDAATRPATGSRQSYAVSAFFELDLAPGETAALLHAVRQAPAEAADDPARLADVFAPLDLEAMAQKLPKAIRECLRNVRPASPGQDPPFFQELPGQRQSTDFLAMADGGELRGRLLAGQLVLETARGRIDLDTEDLLALAKDASPGDGRAVKLWLRGGEVLTGTVAEDSLRFALSSGPEIPIRIAGLTHLRRNRDQGLDSAAIWVRTASGEQLRLGAGWEEAPAHWDTAYGPLDTKLGDVQRIADHDGLRVTLRDGSRAPAGIAASGSVPLGGRFEGRELSLAEVRGFSRPPTPDGAPAILLAAGYAETLAGDRLGWQREEGERLTLALTTDQGRLPVPLREVRRMEREGDAFRVLLWDGSRFVARETGEALILKGAVTWTIPWQNLRSLTGEGSGAASVRRPEMEAALQSLKADDWKTRHAGEETFRALGDLALPWLRLQRESGDADFRHRIKLLLEELASDDDAVR